MPRLPPIFVALSSIAMLLTASVAGAQEHALAVATSPPADPPDHETRSSALMLGIHYDQGKASAFGLSALHAWDFSSSRNGLGIMGWGGVGLDGRVVTRGFHGVDGGLGYAVARFSTMGDAGGFALELAAGVGGDGHAAFPAAAAGVFLGLYYLDIGYSYQFPLPSFDRPDWLSSHQFSVRIHIPVLRYHQRVWDEPRPPR